MSFGFDLGKLNSSTYGVSYVDRFICNPGGTTKTYSSPAFAFATMAKAIILPQEGIPADKIPAFPMVTTVLDTATKTITVTASSSNVATQILVFVR